MVITAESPFKAIRSCKATTYPRQPRKSSWQLFNLSWQVTYFKDKWCFVGDGLFISRTASCKFTHLWKPHFLPIVQVLLKSAVLLSAWMSNSHSSVNLMSCHVWKELRWCTSVFAFWGSMCWMSWRRREGGKRPQISDGPLLLPDKTASMLPLPAFFGCWCLCFMDHDTHFSTNRGVWEMRWVPKSMSVSTAVANQCGFTDNEWRPLPFP